MNFSRQTQMALVRGFVLLATLTVAWWATGFRTEGPFFRSILVGYAAFFLVGTLLTARHFATPLVPLLLLLGDLLAIGAVGCWLHQGFEPQVAFLAGYLVAVLVAVVGRNLSAAVLGTLAGSMSMGLAVTLFATLRHEAPDLWELAYQVVLLSGGAFLAASITGWLEEEARRRQLAERLEQAMRNREAEAAELVTFTQSLAASSSLPEVAEAVIRHLRCHLSLRARAVALEAEGEIVAVWEENGTLGEDHAERRRSLLQDALAKVGNLCVISRLEVRSATSRSLPDYLDFHTLVEVPIRSAGRVAGVLLLGDPKRAAIDDGRIGVVADVARRTGQAVQRIQRQGTEEYRRTSLLLRQMREGVMLLGNDGRVVLANPAARQALGCPSASTPLPEAIGDLTLSDLAETPAGVARRFRARLHHEADHPPVQLACTAVGILDGAKRLGTLVTLSDVTEEELARARLLRSEKLTLVGQTLAGVAHELNNPLTALVGYADLLQARDVPERVSGTLDKIRDQAMRATRIVKNLLSVARQRDPERTPVDVGDVVRSVGELFAYEARLSNVKLDLDIPSRLPKVLGDPHALQQIFVNLTQNAIHALQDSDGETRRIHVRVEVLPDVILATVSDNGGGIPRDLRARVFEPFFTTKGANKGTGLGLAISRTVARDHGGDLILDEDDGAGARFVLRLPVVHAPGAAPPAEESPPPQRDLDLHVLVVDDEKDVREALAAQLGRLGCEVTSTASAGEALRLLAQQDFDALLVDVRMPETSGLDLFHLAAEKEPHKARRMVFMTGDFTNDEVIEAVRATGQRLLEKPFTVDELREALHAHAAPSSVRGPNGRDGNRRSAPVPPSRHATAADALDDVLRAD